MQSILTYCITAWGGACKTYLLKLERAQRALLKVMLNKSFTFSTDNVYEICGVLSIRKLIVSKTVLSQHSKVPYKMFNKNTFRRNNKVCELGRVNSAFAKRFQHFIGPFLYNKLNKILSIYSLNSTNCKIKLSNWLHKQSYNRIENLFDIVK